LSVGKKKSGKVGSSSYRLDNALASLLPTPNLNGFGPPRCRRECVDYIATSTTKQQRRYLN